MDGTADTFGNAYYAAIGSDNFDDGYGCGKCYTVKCTGAYGSNPDCSCDTSKSITIQAIDMCPECSNTHFDFNKDVMIYLTGSETMAGICGVISIEYERVDCTGITNNFKVTNKDGTSKWWYGFHLDDVNDDGGIKSVQLLKDGSWIANCNKANGPSYWLCNGGSTLSASTPLDIKITSDLGKSVTASNCITSFEGGAEMTCNTNLAITDSVMFDILIIQCFCMQSIKYNKIQSSSSGSGSSSNGGTIQILQNIGSGSWWMAIEFPNNDNSAITKLEFRDSSHTSWISGTYESWGYGAYSFGDGTQFSGSQHFRVTTSSGTATSWNVFSAISPESTAYISLP